MPVSAPIGLRSTSNCDGGPPTYGDWCCVKGPDIATLNRGAGAHWYRGAMPREREARRVWVSRRAWPGATVQGGGSAGPCPAGARRGAFGFSAGHGPALPVQGGGSAGPCPASAERGACGFTAGHGPALPCRWCKRGPCPARAQRGAFEFPAGRGPALPCGCRIVRPA